MAVRGGDDEAPFWKHKTCLLNCIVCNASSLSPTLYKCWPAPPLITSPQAYPAARNTVAVRKQNTTTKSCTEPGSKSSSSSALVEIYDSDPAVATALFVWAECGSRLCWDVSHDSQGERRKKKKSLPRTNFPLPMYINFMWSPFQIHIKLETQHTWFIPLDINDCTAWFRGGVSEGKTGGRSGGSWDENASLREWRGRVGGGMSLSEE